MNETVYYHRRPPKSREREAVREWLNGMHFTHFITLSSNNEILSREDMGKHLKTWDSRVNRKLVGPRWHKRNDERMYWMAFPEKADVNPHWHLLLQLLPEQIDKDEERQLTSEWSFAGFIEKIWTQIVPSGTVDVQRLGVGQNNKIRTCNYVTKSLGYEPNLENFVMSREYFKH